MAKKTRVAIVGTGNIGSDLAERILASDDFDLVAVAGRRAQSQNLSRLSLRAKYSSSEGLVGLKPFANEIDGFFDATSAFDHRAHWDLIQSWGKWVVDLTPSKIGKPTVPVLADDFPGLGPASSLISNYSMVTCGGQSSAPVIAAFSRSSKGVSEVEISSSISSDSAGPATRRNIDNYVQTTEALARSILGINRSKAILVLNPADPPPMMRTTVTVGASAVNLELAKRYLYEYVERIQIYIPGYSVAVEPFFVSAGCVSATVSVEGQGFYLPKHAGNLDIINAAAVETARMHALKNHRGTNV